MNSEQLRAAFLTKCQELHIAPTQTKIQNLYVISAVWGLATVQFHVYLLADGDEKPIFNFQFPNKIPIAIYDGLSIYFYALVHASSYWYCTQPVKHKFDITFIGKVYDAMKDNVPDKRVAHKLTLRQENLPITNVVYVRAYNMAIAKTKQEGTDDVLDQIIRKALEKKFEIVHHEKVSLFIPAIKHNYIIEHMCCNYKRGYYNIAVLPEEDVQNKNYQQINQFLENLWLEVYYFPQYVFDVEIVPVPMTWTVQCAKNDLMIVKDLHSATFKHLSNEL